MNIQLDENKSILFLKPSGPLAADNFIQIAGIVDPYLAQHGMLKGVVIETQYFPGWENFQSFMAHVKFVKKHRTKVQKVAVVSDSHLAGFITHCARLFNKPQVKHFPYGQIVAATQWIEK